MAPPIKPFKTCRKCGVEKPREEFNKHGVAKNGVKSWCTPCERQHRRDDYHSDKERAAVINRRAKLKKAYGLCLNLFSSLLELQGGVCAICGTDTPGGRGAFAVDHCHRSGALRGLLCNNCNTGLGLFKDDPEVLGKAIAYLRNGGSESWPA